MSASLLAGVEMAPRDPIIGILELFNADANPKKVNLGIGVYTDDAGKVPLLECVRRADRAILDNPAPWNYLPIDGLAAYDAAVQGLVFGADSAVVKEKRGVTVQALGDRRPEDRTTSCADQPGRERLDQRPSWENHRALFEGAGSRWTRTRTRHAPATASTSGDAPRRWKASGPSIVVLHACCHNPTGYDLTPDEWTRVIEIVKARELVPFLDIAYQGFAESIDADGAAVRRFAEVCSPVFVASSFSKSFSLYGERVGALSIATASADEAARVLSQMKRVVRTNYSNPPTHGGKVVAMTLTTPDLRALWERELGEMRDRIKTMRKALVDGIQSRVPGSDFSFVLRQRGMFSYSGLTKAQVLRLREEYSIYAIETGRICVAALNAKNVAYAADAIARVLKA
jgi:aromatic-amino-acid transaminase